MPGDFTSFDFKMPGCSVGNGQLSVNDSKIYRYHTKFVKSILPMKHQSGLKGGRRSPSIMR